MGDNYHVASAEPQIISKKSPSSALSEIPATVNAEPLPQHQTSPRKPNVLSSIDTTWTLDVDIDDYHMSPPSFQTDFNFPAAYSPFKIPIDNTDGDIVVEVVPIPAPAPSSPSRSWTVIKQGPVLSARQPGNPAQCSGVVDKRGMRNGESHILSPGLTTKHPSAQAKDQDTKVTRKGGRSVPQSNAERCTTYRMRQKKEREDEDEELRTLFEQNRMLKAKEAALRNNISKIKAALLKIGLGGLF